MPTFSALQQPDAIYTAHPSNLGHLGCPLRPCTCASTSTREPKPLFSHALYQRFAPRFPAGARSISLLVRIDFAPHLPRACVATPDESAESGGWQGRQVAVVGRSGAGKSTLFSLLMREVQPDSGHIKIGGEFLNSVDLPRHIALCLQGPHVRARGRGGAM